MSIRSLTDGNANQELGNIFDLLMALHKSNSTSDLLLLFDNTTQPILKPKFNSRKKRQATNTTQTPPTTSTPCPPFSRIRRFLRFMRRVVEIVTVPVIRFAQGVVTPWRRKATNPRPTTTTTTRTPTRPTTTLATTSSTISTRDRPVVENLLNRTEEASAKDRPIFIPIDLTALEEEIMVYESEPESHEPRGFRELQKNSSTDTTNVDSESAELYINSEEMDKNDRFVEGKHTDTCEIMERKFANANDTTSDDAITHLGAYLQFVQLLYTCCYKMRRNDILISWVQTPARINNAVSERVTECGNF